MEWSDHLDDVADELRWLEQGSTYDYIHVSTRSSKTVVTLEYNHTAGDDDE